MSDPFEERSVDDTDNELMMLLAGDVLSNLSDDERSRLAELCRTASGFVEARSGLERLVVKIGLAAELLRRELPALDDGTPMALNPRLIEQIRHDAVEYLSSVSGVEASKRTSLRSERRLLAEPWVGWFVAASVAIVCSGIWWANRPTARELVASHVTTRADADAWLQTHPSAILLSWGIQDPTLLENQASKSDVGTVAWDTITQTGFMSLKSLPVNDPSTQQYQLWIIDPERDEEPIDGGVFDVVQSGETIVPIRAKLKVIDPAGFAVTVEQPGGVVVSDQSRLPLLALVSK